MVFRLRRQGRGIQDQIAPRIEHLDRAEMLGGSGMVEQDQVEQRLADALHLGLDEMGRDIAQRQIVELDIAADVGIDGRRQIFQGPARQHLFGMPHVEEHAATHRRKRQQRQHAEQHHHGRRNPPGLDVRSSIRFAALHHNTIIGLMH